MHRFLVVIEEADGNYSAYCPDLPGCIATGDTAKQSRWSVIQDVLGCVDESPRASKRTYHRKTVSPSLIVSRTSRSQSSSGEISSGLAFRITRSASFPTSIEPFRSSSKYW